MSKETTTQFCYKKLNSDRGDVTRLIELQPGQPLDNISCIVRHCKSGPDGLEKCYEALSYKWGAFQTSCWIRCYGEETESRLATSVLCVQPNCAEALRRLRLEDRSRMLWVDAICINQADEEEKSEQVRKMGWFYKQADRVLVHLSSSEVVSRFKGCRQSERDDLLSHPWFTRVWIIQEVFWAKEILVYFKDLELSWHELKASHQAIEPSILGQSQYAATKFIFESGMRGRTTRPRTAKLLDLIESTKNFNATDPRDKLIALLSIALDVDSAVKMILVDYGVSLQRLWDRLAVLLALRNLGASPLIADHELLKSHHKTWSGNSDLRKIVDRLTELSCNASDYLNYVTEEISGFAARLENGRIIPSILELTIPLTPKKLIEECRIAISHGQPKSPNTPMTLLTTRTFRLALADIAGLEMYLVPSNAKKGDLIAWVGAKLDNNTTYSVIPILLRRRIPLQKNIYGIIGGLYDLQRGFTAPGKDGHIVTIQTIAGRKITKVSSKLSSGFYTLANGASEIYNSSKGFVKKSWSPGSVRTSCSS